jgi:hypothetical protein
VLHRGVCQHTEWTRPAVLSTQLNKLPTSSLCYGLAHRNNPNGSRAALVACVARLLAPMAASNKHSKLTDADLPYSALQCSIVRKVQKVDQCGTN